MIERGLGEVSLKPVLMGNWLNTHYYRHSQNISCLSAHLQLTSLALAPPYPAKH